VRQQTFLLLATLCCLFALLAELGADSIFPARTPSKAELTATLEKNRSEDADIDLDRITKKQTPTPPGIAIRYLALYDGLLWLSLALMTIGGILGARATQDARLASVIAKTYLRTQNVVMLLASLVDVILAAVLALLALAALIAMVALFLAAPFGTVAYLVSFGFFDTSRAATILSFAIVLKIIGTVLVVLGGQVNRRILLRLGISMGLCVVVAFLHGFPPGILVSIVDALTAIVIAIVALLFALPVLFGSIMGVAKSISV
jgi:hypothetical protein